MEGFKALFKRLYNQLFISTADAEMLAKVEALQKALSAGSDSDMKGAALQIEPLSYRYTERGNPYLYRHKENGSIMEIFCTDCDEVSGCLIGTKDMVFWRHEECELIAVKWDNRPEFKDERRGALDLITFVTFDIKHMKLPKMRKI